jgi:flagellar biogenesis protein FliO
MRKEAPRKTSTLAHLWSWLKKKCPVTPDKRLRLAENIPLGEKRFVALVSVDDREFLIGGSASGVSLLSQWESATDSPAADKQVVTIRESFE